MVVCHFYVINVAESKLETDSPTRVCGNRPLTGSFAFERVQTHASQRRNVSEGSCRIQHIQSFKRQSQIETSERSRVLILIEAPGRFVAEALNQRSSVLRDP